MKRIGSVFASIAIAALAWMGTPPLSLAEDVPAFRVDPFWPKPLPNNWIFREIGLTQTGSDLCNILSQRNNVL